MTAATVYQSGWTLDDIPWDRFDRTKIEPGLVSAVKAASLVEHNAAAYVDYLTRVFYGASDQTIADIHRWGREEVQHGLALARWAELADPGFNFESAFARFQSGYQPRHFAEEQTSSVRGSRRGEMIARCVVESGTSSYYSAIRDATDEPVLREIAGRIAADEFRHYKLFYETLHAQDEPALPWWRRLWVATGRVFESGDDELAYAYYCANVSAEDQERIPYRRARYARLYNAAAMQLYRRHHVGKLVQMVAKSIGADPQGPLTRIAGSALWTVMRLKARFTRAPVPA